MRKRTYKKAASFVLALAMAVSVCTAALADNSTEPPTPETTVSEQNGAPEQGNTAAGENTQPEETADEGESENDIAGQDTTQGSNSVTVTDGATLTLAQFNSLTEIPAGVTELTVNLDGVDLRQQSVVVGNDKIADSFRCIKNLSEMAENEVVYEEREATKDYIVNTVKTGITLNIVGTIQFEDAADHPGNDGNFITFKIPDASNIVFKNAVLNGGVRLSPSWNQSFSSTNRDHSVKSLTFDNCTFNGIWLGNGNLKTKSLAIYKCTFNKYDNPANRNNSNPIWFKNIRGCAITIEGNSFYATRPITLVQEDIDGSTIKVINNTFDFSEYDSNNKNEPGKPRNDAILMGSMSKSDRGLGDVEISGNKLINANALIATPQHRNEKGEEDGTPDKTAITMLNGAKITIKDNELNGALLSVLWKTGIEHQPSYFNVIKPLSLIHI